jgi:GNAT superfamily N-acetyltransferase
VAVDETDAVRGFVHTGPVRDTDLLGSARAEIYTVYVEPATRRQGIGSALMAAVDDHWRPTNIAELTLWVFEANAPARAFYERLGWRADGATQVAEFGGVSPMEIRYRRPLAGGDS